MSTELFETKGTLGVSQNTANALMNNLWPQWKSLEQTVAFVDTLNANGDYNGTGNPSTLLTVTGTVEIAIIAVCTVAFLGTSATLELGTALSTAGLIAMTTATGITIGDIWHDNSPDASVELSSVITRKIVNQNVIFTVKTADITAGTLKLFIFWNPISSDGNVALA
jgi:hypothetical protein